MDASRWGQISAPVLTYAAHRIAKVGMVGTVGRGNIERGSNQARQRPGKIP
jgi:hypothetical protein